METLRIYNCFISSPGDCNVERESCKVVIDKINSGLALHMGVNFKTFMWENNVLPDMGSDGQEIIDEHIKKSEYDIFIGIMKNRFGHPTKHAGSGTEHEFFDSLNRKNKSKDDSPRIIFFFGKELVDPEEHDHEQYSKVKEFKSTISKLGLYSSFSSLEEFEKSLEEKLNLFIQELSPLDKSDQKIKEIDIVQKKLQDDLDESLKTYNEQSPIWIDPIISSKRDIPKNPTQNDIDKIELISLIEKPSNIIIKAPSEFGLTTLAHYLKLEAWKNGKTFLYIDSKKTKKHKISKDIIKESNNYFFKSVDKVDCILLDSVCFEETGIMQMIKTVCEEFANIPLMIFNTIDNNFFVKSSEDEKVQIKRDFASYYLRPMEQNQVRKIVTSYSRAKQFEADGDTILYKVTKDLEVLNMHRTPKNCLAILRASSKIGIDYNPINRTKLLETILNTIFEEYEIPTYHDKKPDVKDCSHVLGFFCEFLTTRKNFEFTEDEFKTKINKFCTDEFIELDVNYLLNALLDNSILGKQSGNSLYFKNAYWVFYFIAQRMNLNKVFREKVYTDKIYIDFPEVIEFYTGIDRNKEDALDVMKKDLAETLNLVKGRVNIPDNINPYKSIEWSPKREDLEKEEEKISQNIISSGLPDEVKDRHADRTYNQVKPYHQVINYVMREYSFQTLMRQISASSRALRNSDFVSPPKKKQELLNLIVQGWLEINKLLIALTPILADRGNVAFEGANFYLIEEDFNIDDPERKRLAVLLAVPTNVVRFFKDDLYSSKMAPLLISKAQSESNTLLKHELMLLIIAERPKNWNKIIDEYVVGLDKNSFFLSDVLHTLNFNIEHKATEISEKRLLEKLSKKCRAKHIFKNNNPDPGLINRLDKLEKGSSFQ